MNASDQPVSVLGRLLHELSWVGPTIRSYRNGGRGYENVLTAEVLQGLDFLPRRAFLGAVLAAAHDADSSRRRLVSEVEDARFTLLPGNQHLIPSGDRHQTRLPVQPDGIIESPSTYTILEAKRIRSSSFQAEQLAREYVLALRDAGERLPILLLVVGSAPPVRVAKHGKLAIADAIAIYLETVLLQAENHSFALQDALDRISDVVCWITWEEISQVVEAQRQALRLADASMQACLDRLATSVTSAVAWHG